MANAQPHNRCCSIYASISNIYAKGIAKVLISIANIIYHIGTSQKIYIFPLREA